MKRITLIAIAALMGCALAAPSAFAAKSHLLSTYKVEKHIDLEGEDGAYKVACKGTDIAVDGMWRIDNANQDNDFVYDFHPTGKPAWDVYAAVEPVQAQATSDSEYTFRFRPQGGADVQGKIFVLCLPRSPTTTAGHTHTWTITHTETADGNISAVTKVGTAAAPDCDPGEIAVQPGFAFDSVAGPPAQYLAGHPYRRWWKNGTAKKPLSWEWRFYSPDAGTGVYAVYHGCLALKSSTNGANPHAHKIVTDFKTDTFSHPANGHRTWQVNCGEHYKGAVGAWSFHTGNAYHYGKLWYLGMDPRPKSRAFKVLNSTHGPGAAYDANFGLLCFKDRTS